MPNESSVPTSLPVGLDKFSQYLDTNYAPTDDEVREISQLLEEPSSRIERMTEELEAKENERQLLEASVSTWRTLIYAPIRKIPDDIIREIFIRTLSLEHPSPMHCSYAPMLLLSICSRWRYLALSTPQLWASIHIPIPNARPYYYIEDQTEIEEYQLITAEAVKRRAVAIEAWLECSGACPLDISLYYFGVPDSDRSEAIFTVINKFANRWGKLKVSCPADFLKGLERLQSCDLPVLESLSVSGDGGQSYHSMAGFSLKDCGILQAPKLREVVICQLCEDTTTFPLQWHQLTNLSLFNFGGTADPPSPLRLFEVLRLCQSLVSCRLELPYRHSMPGVFPDPNNEPSLSQISLQHLRFLSLYDGGSDITQLLLLLSVPNLTSFEFFGGTQWTDSPGTKLTPFLTRAGDTLRMFTTDAKLYVGTDLLESLRLCPGLKSLTIKRAPTHSIPHPTISEVKMIDDFLAHFITPNDGFVLCPLLEDFVCQESPMFTDSGLYHFISRKHQLSTKSSSSQSKIVSPLKYVSVTFNRRQGSFPPQEIEELSGTGLVLDCQYIDTTYMMNQFSTLDGLPHSHTPFARQH